MNCPSCGGVIGRDCFNPQECAEITADMANRQFVEPSREEVADAFRVGNLKKPEMTHREEAHLLMLKCIDRLDTTERRLAHGDIEQTLANLYALRITMDRIIFCLATGHVPVPTAHVEVVVCDHPLDIIPRPDGSFYLNIPRQNGCEQYGITMEDVQRLKDSTIRLQELLCKVHQLPLTELERGKPF